MGEETEIFTDEEKVILGEKEPEPAKEPETLALKEGEKPPEVSETAPTEEEKQAAESQGYKVVTEKGKTYFVDDEGTKIPAKRFGAVYREAQEAKRSVEDANRKFNLFRELGPEKYYEVYPDEKPEGWKPKEGVKEEIKEAPILGNMIVQGGPHNGKTLNEVWQEDPAYASSLQTQYLNSEREKVESERQKSERVRQESENEVNQFAEQLSRDLFGKESAKLAPEEEKKIGDTIQSVLDWMNKTKRGGGHLIDSYFLMNREGLIAEAKVKGGREAIESLKKPPILSVDTTGKSTIGPSYEEMSADQLLQATEKMSDAQYAKFLKEAPVSLREKHPSLPWS